MGTRFYASKEAAGAQAAKERIREATGDDTLRSVVSIFPGATYGQPRLLGVAYATHMQIGGSARKSNFCVTWTKSRRSISRRARQVILALLP